MARSVFEDKVTRELVDRGSCRIASGLALYYTRVHGYCWHKRASRGSVIVPVRLIINIKVTLYSDIILRSIALEIPCIG